MNRILRCLLAGIMIAVATLCYLSCDKTLGAFAFSVGILTIFQLDLKLFTGIAGYARRWRDVPYLLTVFVFNIVGCCILFLLPQDVSAANIVIHKFGLSMTELVLGSILCGGLIYVSSVGYSSKNYVLVLLSIFCFIVCGFNHCIANACFIITGRVFEIDSLFLILISALGNTVGSILFRYIHVGKIDENSKDRKKLHS